MDHSAHSTASGEDHSKHLNPWLLGGVGALAAVTLAPYVMPLIGIGDMNSAQNAMHFLGAPAFEGSFGNGLAGAAQGMMASIPGIGGALTSGALVTIPGIGLTIASGALLTIGATAVLGIGGMLLANWMEKHENPHAKIKWSKLVRVAALTSSALVALPGILSGLAVGAAFFVSLMPVSTMTNELLFNMRNTLGATSMNMGPAGGIAALLPHLFTCGAAFIPLALAFFMGKPAAKNTEARMELVSAPTLTKGQPATLAFRAVDAKGRALGPNELSTTFTEKLHTMVVDTSLRDYHHVHPQYDPATGLFLCSVTPQLSGRYMAWHDFTPTGAAKAVHVRTDLPSSNGVSLPPHIMPSSRASADGLNIELLASPPLKAGADSGLRVRVTDDAGQAVERLEPIMGAYGHLAGFSADGRHFIHSHPLNPLGEPLRDGLLEFHLAPEQAGMTKFFLQLRHQGREVTLPFGQPVRTAGTHAERVENKRQMQHQHGLAA